MSVSKAGEIGNGELYIHRLYCMGVRHVSSLSEGRHIVTSDVMDRSE